MSVPMRTGRMRIEYNPDILKAWKVSAIEERLKFEVIRILLGHPYQRQPYKAKRCVLGIASDITLTDLYHKIDSIQLPGGLKYESGLCFEEYYALVDDLLKKLRPNEMPGDLPLGSTDGEKDDTEVNEEERNEKTLRQLFSEAENLTGLWEEDQLAAGKVKEIVRRTQRSEQWGSMAGNLQSEIKATTVVRIDYRTVMSGFRASVLSSRRRLTRMAPNRRYGFQYMGAKRDFVTRLLVAVDVSGSVSDEQVSQALSIINRFFKYGIENIDIIQFDVGLHGGILSMRHARNFIKIEGRGGTDFQAPVNCFLEHRYDGLIMITDGCAPEPGVPRIFYGNILWMLYGDTLWRSRNIPPELDWITRFPKSKFTILPPV